MHEGRFVQFGFLEVLQPSVVGAEAVLRWIRTAEPRRDHPPGISWIRDSSITQERNEHFEGGEDEATFSRTVAKFLKKVPNERHGYYLSNDTP